ncbi:MAG: penicillin acylase family protein [Planctomycetota bacterium]|jgi:penicillin amidase
MKPGKRSATWLVIVLLAWMATAPFASAAESYGKVELIRDQWGVPHVLAETDAGAMYGLGYATAEDRGFQMHYNLRIIQGRLAEVVGEVKKLRRDDTSIQNDRKMRTFGFYRAAKQVAESLDDQTLALLEAYSRGVNDYFEKNRQKRNPTFDEVGLAVEPWTPADSIVSWWHLAQFFATDGTRDLLHWRNLTQGGPQGRGPAAARGGARRGAPGAARRGRDLPRGRPQPTGDIKQLPPDDSTAVVQREDVTDAWLRRCAAFLREHGFEVDVAARGGQRPAGPKFSHAWVAGGKATGTGAAVLVSEPRTPVANPSLLYEFHVQGKSFNARGIGVAGSPVVLIGWNPHVAWGMTALGADQADLFRLETDAEHPDQYQFDGQWRPIEVIREEIRVKGGRPRPLEIRQTHFGPIVNEFAFSRPGDPPVAMKRIPICETGRETIAGALAMLRARNVDELHKALAGWRFPTANVVFGDDQGDVGFSLAGALPLRSPLAPEGGSAAHDGSASKFDWRAIVPHDLMPHVIRPKRGYLFSANHRPIGAFYPISLAIRTGSAGDTLRSWRLRELMTAQDDLSPEYLLKMHYDTVNPARREIVRIGLHLRDVLERDLSPAAVQALARLEDWHEQGGPCDLKVPGAEVAVEINTLFRFVNAELALVYGGGESGLSYAMKTVAKRLDEDPEAEIRPLEQQFVDQALAAAWNEAQRKYGRNPNGWNRQARRMVTDRTLGFFTSLDGFPSLDEAHDLSFPPLYCLDGATILSQTAQAYSQWVPLGDVDTARSNLPVGPSERLDSPMRTVNFDTWASADLHPAPISRDGVERYAQSRATLLP